MGRELWESENEIELKTIYIYGKIYNSYLTQNYECVTAYIHCKGSNHLLPVNVCYDSKKDRYFISRTVYSRISRLYGLPLIHQELYKGEDFNAKKSDSNFAANFSEQSQLSLYGYSVSDRVGLSDEERRDLLASLIDCNLISKYDIISHLDWCITFHKKNPSMLHACSKWKRDLDFISDYKKHEQRKIHAEFELI